MTYVTIKFRRATEAQWAEANPILAEGEIGAVSDIGRFKVGNGLTEWTALPYTAEKGDQGESGPQGDPGPAGADGAVGPRATANVTTASLSNNATEDTTVTLKPGYRLLKIETDVPARIRVYDSTEKRTADASRQVGTDPTGVHGVILDLVTTASNLIWWLSPVVDGYTVAADDIVPLAITNLSGSTDTVSVTITWVRSE